jgi:Tfp pilus assembly protein PilF
VRVVQFLLVPLLLLVVCGCPSGGGAGGGGIPEPVVRHNNLGTSYLSQQKWGEAAAEFRRGLETLPDDPILLNNVAVALLQQGKPDEAEQSLRLAVESDPDHAYAHYNLGLIERNRGNFEAAASHFQAVADRDPNEVFTQYNLGSTLARVDRVEDAAAALRRALELNPTHVSSLYALGRLLVQTGEQDEGLRLITLSQEIRSRSGLDEAVGHQYGEQGPYAMGADYPGGGLSAPAAIPVTFRPEPESLEQPREDPEVGPPFRFALHRSSREGSLSLVTSARPMAPEEGNASFALDLASGVKGSLGFDFQSAKSGDLDGDGAVEFVVLRHETDGATARLALFGVDFTPTDGARLDDEPLVVIEEPTHGDDTISGDLALVDSDHDGDLDVFACWGAGCALAINDGSGAFSPSPNHGISLSPGEHHPLSVGFLDFDNDRDIDLIVASPAGVRLFSNNRDGSFADVSDTAGLGDGVGDTHGLAVGDLNKDGFMDLVAVAPGTPRLLLNRNGRFEAPVELPVAATDVDYDPEFARSWLGPLPVHLTDLDNDGFLDVVAGRSWAGGTVFVRNLGNGSWDALDYGIDYAVALFPVDHDGDGDNDFVAAGPGGFGMLVNEGGNANNWITIEPSGVGDNGYGIGTKIEILAGALRQKFEVTAPLPLHLGLGTREQADAVRLLWPGGVLQDELNQPAREIASIEQLDRKGTSCPLLYAWRDGRYRFVTDFLGGCAIGYQHAPGVFSTPDTDEYVKIEGGLSVVDGTLRIRLNNQLEEVIWFDQAQLVVVDHPQGTEVYPNERLMPGPPFPEFRLFASSDVRPIRSAKDPATGHDVTEWLAERDRRWVVEFDPLPFKGYATMHTLEIDLGDVPTDRRLVLLLDGWIDYADSSANIAASQAGVALVPPRLYVADGRGGWRETKGLMGFPAGLPKAMVVDLSGEIGRDPRIRIETNMRIYWDRARVMVGGEGTPLEVRRLEARSAELRFGGFPKEWSEDGRMPYGYDPDRVEPTRTWKAHVGAYTAFGDVAALAREIDDRFVTTRNGDEMELVFDAPGAPAPGMTRSYLLYADGFGKDMDPNSAANNEVGPIPFHGMPTYPYGPEVTPPAAALESAGLPARVVPPSGRGWPGAPPLKGDVSRTPVSGTGNSSGSR